LILLIIVPAVIIIYDEMNKIKDEIKKKFQYRKAVAKRNENKNSDEVIEEIEKEEPPRKIV
jgi:vacuolar-type H+-ATPase subunit E/Vma4